MERIRKISKVFNQKDKPSTDSGRLKPTYRGAKPLTVSDIHSHSPLVAKTALEEWIDELGSRRPVTPPPPPTPEGFQLVDILQQFPKPPAGSRTGLTNPDLFYPKEELLPPLPENVVRKLKKMEHARTFSPTTSSSRPPLYSSSRFNMSTYSLGANTRLNLGPAERSGNSAPQHTIAPLHIDKKLPPIPERKRLGSAPTPVSRSKHSRFDTDELQQAYSSIQGPRS